MKYAYEQEVARLKALARTIRLGDPLPDEAASTMEVAAAIIRGHGELLNRLKAAMGPAPVFAAKEEAKAGRPA